MNINAFTVTRHAGRLPHWHACQWQGNRQIIEKLAVVALRRAPLLTEERVDPTVPRVLL